MKKQDSVSGLFDIDSAQTEWSKISFDMWSREQAREFVTVPGLRVVDIYKVVQSVIDNDLSDTERTAARLCWFQGKSAAAAADELGIARSAVYKLLTKSKEKIRLVLKHIVECEEYKTDNELI